MVKNHTWKGGAGGRSLKKGHGGKRMWPAVNYQKPYVAKVRDLGVFETGVLRINYMHGKVGRLRHEKRG